MCSDRAGKSYSCSEIRQVLRVYFFREMSGVPNANRYIYSKQTGRLEKPVMKPPRVIVGSGKKTRFVAQDRDVQFMADLEALLLCPKDAIWASTSVSRPLASYLFPSVSILKPRSKRKTWWQSTDTGRGEFKTPSDARSMSIYLKAEYLMLALREIGPLHAFTLNLRPDIAAMACADPSTRDFLRRRLTHHLETILARAVDFFFVIEQAAHRRVHIHGCLGISAEEAKAARLALRKAGGEWEVARQHQSHTEEDPDAKWNSYVTKECAFSSKWMRALCEADKFGPKIIFKGPALFVSRSLGAKAQALYETHRDLVLSASKAKHPVLIDSRKARAEAKISFFESLGY